MVRAPKKKNVGGWHVIFTLCHCQENQSQVHLEDQYHGPIKKKMQKDSPNQLQWLTSHGFFWLHVFPPIPFWGYKFLQQFQPQPIRILNLPSTKIPMGKSSSTDREKYGTEKTRRQEMWKGNPSSHIDLDIRQGSFYDTHPNDLPYFRKITQNCHTFAIKFDDQPKKQNV